MEQDLLVASWRAWLCHRRGFRLSMQGQQLRRLGREGMVRFPEAGDWMGGWAIGEQEACAGGRKLQEKMQASE